MVSIWLRHDGLWVTAPETDPDLSALGRAIRHARSEAGISQEELGYRSKLSARYVSDLERGTRNVGAKALFKLARALGITPAVFFKD